MRKETFESGEYYHIYNRGVDKRSIFLDQSDLERFSEIMQSLNTVTPEYRSLASAHEEPIVSFVAFHVLDNHFHFVLQQIADDGIRKYMHKLGTSYTNYFNKKYDRNGSLFQGPYKARHVPSDRHLLHVFVYATFNDEIHESDGKEIRFSKSSRDEYFGETDNAFCDKGVILGQFPSPERFEAFCSDTLKDIIARRRNKKGRS